MRRPAHRCPSRRRSRRLRLPRPATATTGLPDLIVANISGPQALVIPSGSSQVVGTFAVTVSNVGGSGTGQFSNVLVRSPGNVAIPLAAVSGLDPGESIILTVDVTFDAPANYTLQAQADSGHNVSERTMATTRPISRSR